MMWLAPEVGTAVAFPTAPAGTAEIANDPATATAESPVTSRINRCRFGD